MKVNGNNINNKFCSSSAQLRSAQLHFKLFKILCLLTYKRYNHLLSKELFFKKFTQFFINYLKYKRKENILCP